MANGYFERGEIYKVRMDYGIGSEEGAFRPGVVISSNQINNTSSLVLVAYISRKSMGRPRAQTDVEILATGIASYVLCAQIGSVDKSRLMGYMGKLSYAEQKAVDDTLEDIIDLGYVDETTQTEITARDVQIGELRTELAGVRAALGTKDEEIASLKMEIEMWQKCYGRCMDMLVDVKVNGDLSRKTVVEPKMVPAPVVEEKPPVVEQPEPEVVKPKLVDINSATFTQLRGIGLSNNIVLAVINKRPFKSVEDMKNIPGMNAKTYNIIEKKICCVPVVIEESVKKVNVNTATPEEMREALGLNMVTCNTIRAYRNKNGPFAKIEDLLNVKHIYAGTLKRLGHLMEV